MDIVSQLQENANHISFLLFNSIGTLQRDARPSPIHGKPLPKEFDITAAKPAVTSNAPVGGDNASNPTAEDQAPEMAVAFAKALKTFDDLVHLLPEEVDQGDAAMMEKIKKLQEENEAVEREIADELEGVEADLKIVRRTFRSVADKELRAQLQ